MTLFKNTRWRFFVMMEEILPNGGGTMGAAAYNAALLAAQAPVAAMSASTFSSAMASGSALGAANAEVGSNAMGLAISVPSPCNIPVGMVPADGFRWDKVISAFPSTGTGFVASSSMNMPPSPSSVLASSTGKHSHSSAAAVQSRT
ncbi:uncharacterized protein BJ212DRAFT_1578036 [Suillus subaureus]|uniref:Uncharacterized protein n=1 Tax=Suillus subaureus TaxID=48587 RepID=A0A9P7JC52_9AGAM|nr:uncharacterized protein BJ212DRAFT_1578036 [Suillus subaureus]KAG1814440.1 hypothetical protein BJ212DRAFT_1578036 [Suillus subaureus]